MRILVASDKFKGSLTAPEACEAIAAGLREGLPEGAHEIRCLPVADGGDGMARTLVAAGDGEWVGVEATGPLGERVEAGYGLLEDGRLAAVDMAEVSGLARLGSAPNDPWRASTAGTGELIRHAAGRGVERLILGIGGSATVDGGTGMARALGVRFLDATGAEVADLPAGLESVREIAFPRDFAPPPVVVACDVTNPLLGPEGTVPVYGPQKGVDPADFERYERRLAHLVERIGHRGDEAASAPGAGAAGGLGFGCLVLFGAELVPGFDLVADLLDLEAAVAGADLVVTGEGRLDRQSLRGKAPHGVVGLARAHGVATAAFCGTRESAEFERAFGPIREIRRPGRPLDEDLAEGSDLLRESARGAAGELIAAAGT